MNEIFGVLSILLGGAIQGTYLLDTIKQKIKPHPFTWLIWFLSASIVFFAQVYEGAGPGAWMNGIIAFLGFFILIFSFKNGVGNIRKVDYICLFLAGISIPLWVITNDPVYSVILISLAVCIGFIPTLIKSVANPYDEPLYFFSLNIFRHIFALLAMSNFTLTTTFFHFALIATNGVLFVFLILRRKKVL